MVVVIRRIDDRRRRGFNRACAYIRRSGRAPDTHHIAHRVVASACHHRAAGDRHAAADLAAIRVVADHLVARQQVRVGAGHVAAPVVGVHDARDAIALARDQPAFVVEGGDCFYL